MVQPPIDIPSDLGQSYLVVGGWARVPDHELLVVGDGAEEGLVQQVPRHVLHHGGVAGEDRLGVDHLKIKWKGN